MTDSDKEYIETYRSLITLSVEGFKFSSLANGGATVALLAYLGNVAGKGFPTPDMREPVLAFVLGLVACGLSMLFGYLTQLRLLNEIGCSEKLRFRHNVILWIAIVLFACSVVAFGVGSYLAVTRFH